MQREVKACGDLGWFSQGTGARKQLRCAVLGCTLAMVHFLAWGTESPAPWAPGASCKVAPRGANGLYPSATTALNRINVAHRITQTINSDTKPSNYHGADNVFDAKPVTGAVDLSTHCLSSNKIKVLLSALAREGFAAWYRQDGVDGWKGNPHVHAIWAAEPVNRQLRDQLDSWMAGRNGLVGNGKYTFWQPSPEEREAVTEARAKASTASALLR